jgi:hypothetical protein
MYERLRRCPAAICQPVSFCACAAYHQPGPLPGFVPLGRDLVSTVG